MIDEPLDCRNLYYNAINSHIGGGIRPGWEWPAKIEEDTDIL
jgi:hypothetical protein